MTRPTTEEVADVLKDIAERIVAETGKEWTGCLHEAIRRVEAHPKLVDALREILTDWLDDAMMDCYPEKVEKWKALLAEIVATERPQGETDNDTTKGQE